MTRCTMALLSSKMRAIDGDCEVMMAGTVVDELCFGRMADSTGVCAYGKNMALAQTMRVIAVAGLWLGG